MRTDLRRILLFILILSGFISPELSATTEYEIKAGFLLNFFRFAQWPKAFQSDTEKADICILGRDPFRRKLHRMAALENFSGRRFLIRKIEFPEQSDQCRMVFVSAFENDKLASWMPDLMRRGVLLVTETRDLLKGGTINFVKKEINGKVYIRFEVREKLLKKSGIRLSSELLKLSHIIQE